MEDQEGQEKHKAPRSTAPPPESRPVRVYLTLRVLSSLDQESVEGKEGRDEEEVTSALLPIWKGKKKHARGKYKTNKIPASYPGFSLGFPGSKNPKQQLSEISAEISVTGGLTDMLADDRNIYSFSEMSPQNYSEFIKLLFYKRREQLA